MEQDKKEQADEGSPLKEGEDVVGSEDQIVKVEMIKDHCQSELTVLLSRLSERLECGRWRKV